MRFYNKLKLLIFALFVLYSSNEASSIEGWLDWRGPSQNGVSLETGLPDSWELDGKNHGWTYEIWGRGTPVIAGNRVYSFGYYGAGPARMAGCGR